MSTKETVITPERFKTGKSFQEYLDSDIRNRELFESNYEGTRITPEQEAALKELAARPNGPDHMVIIGEDWCPDVYRGMPVGTRIAEAMGIEVRIFERDQNKDMIQEYLNQGEFESIPVFVFYTKDHKEIAHFIERPKLANEQMGEVAKITRGGQPDAIREKLGREPTEDEIREERARVREAYLEWQRGPTWAGWRDATVDEVIELLRANT